MAVEDQPLSPEEWSRAVDYPYPSPPGSFRLHLPAGDWATLNDGEIPETEPPGCRAVLAVGSNAAPEQLARKLRSSGTGPLLNIRAELIGFDVVFAARVASYGAVPATFIESPGTTVSVLVNLLDPDRFDLMNRSEALGVAYELFELDAESVRHHRFRPSRLDGYRALCGPLLAGGEPIALAAVAARGRTFPAATERDLLTRVAEAHDSTLDEFIRRSVRDPDHRRSVNAILPTAGLP